MLIGFAGVIGTGKYYTAKELSKVADVVVLPNIATMAREGNLYYDDNSSKYSLLMLATMMENQADSVHQSAYFVATHTPIDILASAISLSRHSWGQDPLFITELRALTERAMKRYDRLFLFEPTDERNFSEKGLEVAEITKQLIRGLDLEILSVTTDDIPTIAFAAGLEFTPVPVL